MSETNRGLVVKFYRKYGISKKELAKLINVDDATIRKYLNGGTIRNDLKERIEVALAIIDNGYFHFNLQWDDKSNDYIERIERYEDEERQKAEFLSIFNEFMNDDEKREEICLW